MHSSTQHQFAANLAAAAPFFHPAFSYAAFRSIEAAATIPLHPAFLPPTSALTAPTSAAALQNSAFSAVKGRSFTIDAILGKDSSSTCDNRSSDEENDVGVATKRQQRRYDSPIHQRSHHHHPYLNALSTHMQRYNSNQTIENLQIQKDKSDGKTGGKNDWKPTKSKRVRTIFTPEQLERLEAEFERQQYMVGTERFYLASSLNLSEAQVKVWFQNRRIKWRKQNLEQQHAKLAKLNLLRTATEDDEDDSDSENEASFPVDDRSGSGSPNNHHFAPNKVSESPILSPKMEFTSPVSNNSMTHAVSHIYASSDHVTSHHYLTGSDVRYQREPSTPVQQQRFNQTVTDSEQKYVSPEIGINPSQLKISPNFRDNSD